MPCPAPPSTNSTGYRDDNDIDMNGKPVKNPVIVLVTAQLAFPERWN
jgi:hypothetical protein